MDEGAGVVVFINSVVPQRNDEMNFSDKVGWMAVLVALPTTGLGIRLGRVISYISYVS